MLSVYNSHSLMWNCGDGVGMGGVHQDGQKWGSVSVPVQTSTVVHHLASVKCHHWLYMLQSTCVITAALDDFSDVSVTLGQITEQ